MRYVGPTGVAALCASAVQHTTTTTARQQSSTIPSTHTRQPTTTCTTNKHTLTHAATTNRLAVHGVHACPWSLPKQRPGVAEPAGPHIVEICLSRHLARDRSGWNRDHIPVSFLALPPCAPMVRFFLFLRMYPTVGLSYGCLARPQVLISCASECDIKRLREHPRIFRDCQPPSGVVRPHLLGIPNGRSTLRLGFSA